jgi:hypothetical protein
MRSYVLGSVLIALVLVAVSSHAATLSMSTDKSTYDVGETITLTIVGDAEGEADVGIFGTVVYDPGRTTVTGQSQSSLTSLGGGLPWINGVLFLDFPNAGTADALNTIAGLVPQTPDQLVISVITLTADAEGAVNFQWLADGGSESLSFFSLTNAPGASITIVPEPSTAFLVGLGLVGLGLRRARIPH